MKTLSAEPLFHVQNELGEGPIWHPIEERLYWVDIVAGDYYQSNSELTGFTKTHFNTMIGAFGFTKDNSLILATTDGFSTWKPGQDAPKVFWNPLPNREEVRLNDGKVDPAGRFWAGSMDPTNVEGELYRVDPDGCYSVVLKNIGISNGLGWSPDRKIMYYTDSSKYTVYAFDYDLDTGGGLSSNFLRMARGLSPMGYVWMLKGAFGARIGTAGRWCGITPRVRPS